MCIYTFTYKFTYKRVHIYPHPSKYLEDKGRDEKSISVEMDFPVSGTLYSPYFQNKFILFPYLT